MEFRHSGLPQDPTVFKAYVSYIQNTQDLPPEVRDNASPLRAARVLGETANDNSAATLALLQVMPPATWGVVENRFGRETVDRLAELRRHHGTGYAYLRDASAPVKQLALAQAILMFDDFKSLSENLDRQIESLMTTGSGSLTMPYIPPATPFDKIAQAAQGASGAPRLEELFDEKLYDFKNARRDCLQKLEQLGIAAVGVEDAGFAPPEVRYPLFEETGLFDSPKVRTAYDTIINHTRVAPENFEAALSVGRLLSTITPSVNPTAVATALLDVGIPGMNRGDFDFMKDKFDWDVLEVLTTASVHQLQSPVQILAAPVEFRQVALADAVAKLEDAQKAGQHILDHAAQTPDFPKGHVHQTFLELKHFGRQIERMYKPVIGKTDIPELDTLFENKLKVFHAFTDMHLPKQEAPAPKPQENKPNAPKNQPRPGNGGFSL